MIFLYMIYGLKPFEHLFLKCLRNTKTKKLSLLM